MKGFRVIGAEGAVSVGKEKRKFGVKRVDRDLQIEVRGRLRVGVLSSEHAHFENFRPPNLKRVLSTENSYW